MRGWGVRSHHREPARGASGVAPRPAACKSTATCRVPAAVAPPQDSRSFYEQFQDLKGTTNLSILNSGAYPKPSLAANAKAPTAQAVPLSDVVACGVERPLLAAVPKTLSPEEVEFERNFTFFFR